MLISVEPKDIIDAVEPVADEWHAYISRSSGKITSFSAEDAVIAEAESADDLVSKRRTSGMETLPLS